MMACFTDTCVALLQFGMAALHFAAAEGHTETVQWLAAQDGVNVNATDEA